MNLDAQSHRLPSSDLPWEGGAVTSNFSRKCEALAVSGLVEYGDEIDVIAPADILKQIFKMPYSKARLSIAVHRVGQTLVLNTGPDVEEGEKLIRRHNNQSKSADSLFLNFAMHSVRMEACDCPPTHHVPSQKQSNSCVLPGGNRTQFAGKCDSVIPDEGSNCCSEYPQVKQDSIFWGSKKNKRNKGRDHDKKASQVGEKPRCSMQESEKHRRVGNDGFRRVLFWQFHNFRMLLGSDLLLFSNEKYVAVSLHLWDVTRQVTPLTWLEAWLDNVMASVPELAICYHQNGVVQGYELLKTDDIFLLKGISEDGTPAFYPYVIQQNGVSVLRFLQDNCKQDPGAYWLYKSAGEDVIQLFDLSVIPKNHSSDDSDDASSSLSSLLQRGRSDSLYSLGTLLYRIAHRLSFSMASNNRARCVRFFQKCLDFLDEPDHLVVRACAHEQFARLILNYDEELDLTSESLPVECEVTVIDAEEESLDFVGDNSESVGHEKVSSLVAEDKPYEDGQSFQDLESETSVKMTLEAYLSASEKLIEVGDTELTDPGAVTSSSDNESSALCKVAPTPVQTVVDPISSKLAAVHHVSQAIKSLRWMRQLQSTEPQLVGKSGGTKDALPSSTNFSVCACGDADCIEVCDIREWLPTLKLDHKLWKLVLLLGESYLALGQAYKEDGQLHQALKVVELACSTYGSMPQHLEDTRFISSMISCSSLQKKFSERNEKARLYGGDMTDEKSSSTDDSLTLEQYSSTYLFWARVWTLVGDVYVEFHAVHGKEISMHAERKSNTRELRISSEVVKEVKRLKKQLGQRGQNCSSCSLVNCSCQSDRASSGSSASSSNADMRSVGYGRKQSKKVYSKNTSCSLLGDPEDGHVHHRMDNTKTFDGGHLQHNGNDESLKEVPYTDNANLGLQSLGTNTKKVDGFLEIHGTGSTVASQTEMSSRETPKVKNGGIFKYLGGPVVRDAEHNLLTALTCYEEATKALGGFPSDSAELQSVVKKKGWVFNELGRNRLERRELNKAEVAFADAINAFREVSDHTNIILINCNLGHGRRALAEEMVSKIEDLKVHALFHNAYNQALENAKLEYTESLRYYGAAKSELILVAEGDESVTSALRNEVQTQFAHTYLRLGMLLAKEDVTTEVFENGALEGKSVGYTNSSDRKARKESRKHEISANDAIRVALSVYESLGELRKQEAAFAYFQLACYQRECCLKFLKSDQKNSNFSKGENSILQRVKQYASLAERNWHRAIDFYGPQTHPTMYLTILIEGSALSLTLFDFFHSNAMLESALSRMLEGRYVSDKDSDSFRTDHPDTHAKFWRQLQMLLKKMLAVTISGSANKSSPVSQTNPVSNRSGEAGKLRELYKMSLMSTDMSELHAMHTLWTS
ncbi:uncharacterized protein LOC122318422 isoform X2 [Carya illinoinensis]|uniref:EDRF1 N-terminal domain-containing protein n=1 Tax=Carya illinoinensis TaxID=32201 RepID=A0A8T1PS63_CARIL|nr:uncharacterized protein LOC122318422 isoform X2 [Carya illinoinensis]KAG6644511.1 hypothetical protein CIPAW_08G058900 [Carya illinoinensis]KAG6644513.1 hypothetical protein CIPAW_08G058900 [Carya illinoinensis]KAG6699278.1 hypothetical protein I3842_08G060100 [Carya illinoinensis]